MKTAFAHWNNRIAPVFDTAEQIRVVEMKEMEIVGESEETIPADFPLEKTLRLVELKIDTLVCGARMSLGQGLLP